MGMYTIKLSFIEFKTAGVNTGENALLHTAVN